MRINQLRILELGNSGIEELRDCEFWNWGIAHPRTRKLPASPLRRAQGYAVPRRSEIRSRRGTRLRSHELRRGKGGRREIKTALPASP